MYSHTTVGTNDRARAEKFYDAVMAALGQPVLFKTPKFVAYGAHRGEALRRAAVRRQGSAPGQRRAQDG